LKKKKKKRNGGAISFLIACSRNITRGRGRAGASEVPKKQRMAFDSFGRKSKAEKSSLEIRLSALAAQMSIERKGQRKRTLVAFSYLL